MKKIYITKVHKVDDKIVEVKFRRTLYTFEEEIEASLNWLVQQMTDPRVVVKTAVFKNDSFTEGSELVLVENSSGVVSIRTKANNTTADNLDKLPVF